MNSFPQAKATGQMTEKDLAEEVERIYQRAQTETLAECRTERMGLWESLAVPKLREQGKSAEDIARLFETQTEEAKDFAYALAEQITVGHAD
jgi:hypothetical protein